MKILAQLTAMLFFAFFFAMACQPQNNSNTSVSTDSSQTIQEFEYMADCDIFTRNKILERIKQYKAEKRPLIVHIFVPLCDNEHQGIVPVNKSLGDGFNLKTNLYWGAGYGIKTHFKRKTEWKLISDQFDIDSNILERIIFSKQYNPDTKVILIADAYRGDRMEACMLDFFNSLAGTKEDLTYNGKDSINLKSNTDLLIFNGHNGLMDMEMPIIQNRDNIEKDVAVISCLSSSYFINYLKCLKAYPLVTTTSLLPPEAYIAEGIINAWALQKSQEEIRLSAGNAMYGIFKKNQKALRAIFKTGW